MNQQQAAPFEQLLRQQRAALHEQLVALRGGNVGRVEAAAEHFGHPEDSQAQVNTERDLEFALDERESAALAAVDAALARIREGTYGECTDCGVYIGEPRLRIAPEAPRCLRCQEKYEAQHPVR